jgi:hypothetical protein
MIAERRDVKWEQEEKGKPCKGLNNVPPCIYSINAFGADELTSCAPRPSVSGDVPEILTYLRSCRAVLVLGEGNSILKGVKVSDLKY